VAGGDLLVSRILDAFAGACYRFRRSVFARLAFLALMLLALGTTLFARPKQIENQTVKNYTLREISISSIGSYARVTGVLNPLSAFRTNYRVGSAITLYGSRFVPLVNVNTSDYIYILDEGLPETDRVNVTTIVGEVMMGTGQQPPLYLRVGLPPNVVLANTLARIGIGVIGLGVFTVLLLSIMSRLDYAIPFPLDVRSTYNDRAPNLIWFGDLGKQYNDAVLRGEPTRLSATIHEAKFSSERENFEWSTSLKQLKSAQLLSIASHYGVLPAARIKFVDERGLRRRAVIATQSKDSRNSVLEVLGLIRN
jgi:hypothetical protein